MGMSIAVCVATPFQALNAINLVCNSLTKNDRKVLFYRDYSAESHSILLGIKKYHIFDCIYEYDLERKDNIFKYIINDVVQAVNPLMFVKWITKAHVDLHKESFDKITITSGTELEVALARIYPTASIIAYDDGLGSYVGDIVHDHKLNIIWKLLGRRTDSIWPECLYVNNVEFCDSKLSKNKKKLLTLENTKDNYSSMVYDIFGVSNSSVYDSRHLVYLSQPLGELGANMDRYEDLIENALNEFKEFGIYRKHPRDSRKTMLEFIQDDSNCIWELICGDRVDNNSVLIACCSTTQIMPKILYNKEPWIIFTYKIYGIDKTEFYKTRFYPVITRLRSCYTNKYRIVEPASIEELVKDIREILEKERLI